MAYVYAGPGILYALNGYTGEEHWTYTTHGGGGWSDPLVVWGTVYVTAGRNYPDAGGLYAVDAATGKKRWTYPGTHENSFGSTLAFANNTVYVGFGDELLALDTADGKKQWGRTLASFTTGQLLIVGDTLYASGEGHSYALNAATGEEVWNYPTGATNIELADSVLYIGRRMEDSFEVLALDSATGKKHWSYPAFDIFGAGL
jgi:outer membrane protein assembly factor BamB